MTFLQIIYSGMLITGASRSCNWILARCRRDFTVPTGQRIIRQYRPVEDFHILSE